MNKFITVQLMNDNNLQKLNKKVKVIIWVKLVFAKKGLTLISLIKKCFRLLK